MSNFKSFLSGKVIATFVLSFTMWIVYFYTDYKVDTPDEGYLVKSIIFLSALISLCSSIYFVNALVQSELTKKAKAIVVASISIIGCGLMYCKFGDNADFLKNNYSTLVLLSLCQLFILMVYGVRDKEESVSEFEAPHGALNKDDSKDDDDGLDQTKMSLNIDEDNLK